MQRLKISTRFCLSLLTTCLIVGLTACDKNKQSEVTEPVPKPLKLYLNDTGVIGYTQNFAYRTDTDPVPQALSSTPDNTAPDQDADIGNDRDANVSDNDGRRGFQFVRLDAEGKPFTTPPSDYALTPWSCVKDKVTGLIWEVKTISGLQAYYNNFSWYNSDSKTNGGNAGATNDNASCYQTLNNCNTEEYVKAVNKLNSGAGLCGLNQWRLPLREELRSLVDYSVTEGPMIDTAFFPYTMPSDTWSAQTAFYGKTSGEEAWELHFNTGHSEAHDKSDTEVYVILVHDPVE